MCLAVFLDFCPSAADVHSSVRRMYTFAYDLNICDVYIIGVPAAAQGGQGGCGAGQDHRLDPPQRAEEEAGGGAGGLQVPADLG